MSVHCWSCNKVKGKRSCPAHGGDGICSRCCGTKRRVEIQCPEDCPYLYGEHDPRWEPPERQMEDARFIASFTGLTREQIPLLVSIHSLLVQARRERGGELPDGELLEVVSTLTKTFETLSKGILYEHKSGDPKLQGMINWLGRGLTQRQEIEGFPPASDDDVKAVLSTVSAAIEAHQKQEPGGRSYLDIAERVFRASLAQMPAVEIPGEGPDGRLIVEP